MTSKQTKNSGENPRVLIILGMHRSGTSALAGVCNLLGAELGKDVMLPGEDNPTGFWENRLVYEFNQRLLAHIGMEWDHPGPVPPAGWDDEEFEPFYRQAQELLRSEFGAASSIVIKDPRICRLLPFWQRVWERLGWSPVYLFCLREPCEVVASLARREEEIAPPHGEILWLRYYRDAERQTRSQPRALVTYAALLENWRSTLRQAWQRLGLEWQEPEPTTQSTVDNFLKPSLRHYKGQTDVSGRGGMRLTQSIYDAICRNSDDVKSLGRLDPPVLSDVDRALAVVMAGGAEQPQWPVWAAALEAALYAQVPAGASEPATHKEDKALEANLETLVQRIQRHQTEVKQLQSQKQSLERQVEQAQERLEREVERLQSDLAHRQAEVERQKTELGALRRHADVLANHAIGQEKIMRERQELANSLAQQRDRMLASRSWRYTAPLRTMSKLSAPRYRRVRSGLKHYWWALARRYWTMGAQLRAASTGDYWRIRYWRFRAQLRTMPELLKSRSKAALRGLRREIAWIRRDKRALLRRPLRLAWRVFPAPRKLRWHFGLFLCRHFPALMRGTWIYSIYHPGQPDSAGGEYLPAPEAHPPTHRPGLDGEPVISVIIPVHNNWVLTSACLDSLRSQGALRPFEVVVVDDASTDETPRRLSACADVVAVRNEDNLGFIGACNRGAEAANGEYIVLLNNDTQVHAGWLDFLYETFRDDPNAGLVGAKLLYPNGTLQEAGGIIWKDANGWNYGRNDDRDRPEYNYLRDADYCSGACLMIRRDLFLALGGFDERYAPAYYEDTDLAFRVREAGRRVLYQPLARITHFEGGSHGTDESGGVKRHQGINRKRLLKQWKHTLAAHETPEGDFSKNRQRTMRGRVLMIDAVTPMPDSDSGSVDAFNLMRILTRMSLQISFIPEDNLAYFGRYTNALQALGVECWHFPYLSSIKDHLSAYGHRYDIVILSRLKSARRHMEAVRHHCPQAKIVFNTVDLHFLREMRQAQLKGSFSLKKLASRTKQLELSLMEASDLTLVISPAERQLLKDERPDLKVAQLPLILEEGTGSEVDFSQRRDLFFLGGFQHPPNVDAVHWLIAEVWPRVSARLPAGVRLHVIGSQMPPEIEALAGDDVIVAGFVPDVDAYIAGMRLSVAPMRYGAGLKGKVARSLKHGIPCVASEIAAEGMAGDSGGGIVTASVPEDYARVIAELYGDAERWGRASQEARAFFETHYSYAAGVDVVQDILKQLGKAQSANEEQHKAVSQR